MEMLSTKCAPNGLRCCAVREFGALENAAIGMPILTGMGGWTFVFCDAKDMSMRRRRVESYLFFDDGIQVDGNWERMAEIVYRRLMDSLESKAARSGTPEFDVPDVPQVH